MTMRVIFLEDHEQYNKGEVHFVERSLALRLNEKKVLQPFSIHKAIEAEKKEAAEKKAEEEKERAEKEAAEKKKQDAADKAAKLKADAAKKKEKATSKKFESREKTTK